MPSLLRRPTDPAPPCACGCGDPIGPRAERFKAGHQFKASAGRIGNNGGKKGWEADDVGYFGAHRRLYRKLGSAAAHQCVDCSAPAGEWSFKDQTGYSTDPADYSPRCVRCHRNFDRRA